MTTINTNGININYPVPGVNNNSQGFRDNFNAIRTNLNTAGDELSDLQSKVILKSALNNSMLNNDMANTLISNASILNFRHTTYNLGSSLSGIVNIDIQDGDVQYGTITGDTSLTFCCWGPTDVKCELDLQLTFANANAVVSFPSSVSLNESYGASTLENFANVVNLVTVSKPHDVDTVNYRLSTINCGTDVIIEPVNRPRKTTQIQLRSPAPTGFQGDVAGTVAVDANYLYVCTDTFDSSGSNLVTTYGLSSSSANNEIVLSDLTGIAVNTPVIFTDALIEGISTNSFGGIATGTAYYVKTIVMANNAITLSETRVSGVAGSTFPLWTQSANVLSTSVFASFYNGSDIWKKVALTAW